MIRSVAFPPSGFAHFHKEVTVPSPAMTLLAAVPDVVNNVNLSMFLSVASSCVTGYFWLVKMRRERAGLQLYRAAGFRPDRLQCSDLPGKAKAVWYGEVFLANPSTLPAAVVRFGVQLLWKGRWIDGALVMDKKDGVPWTVEPLRVLARGFGCAFQVEECATREQLLQSHRLRFTLVTVDGRARRYDIEMSDPSPALAA
jgi:hypothetical protein